MAHDATPLIGSISTDANENSLRWAPFMGSIVLMIPAFAFPYDISLYTDLLRDTLGWSDSTVSWFMITNGTFMAFGYLAGQVTQSPKPMRHITVGKIRPLLDNAPTARVPARVYSLLARAPLRPPSHDVGGCGTFSLWFWVHLSRS